jgi:hypothetical protein
MVHSLTLSPLTHSETKIALFLRKHKIWEVKSRTKIMLVVQYTLVHSNNTYHFISSKIILCLSVVKGLYIQSNLRRMADGPRTPTPGGSGG